ncbi:MAG: S46 family peptidase [Acidobacteriota bacterium]
MGPTDSFVARRVCFLAAVVLAVSSMAAWPARGDEGQWPPDRLDRLDWADLSRRGLALTPGDLWQPAGTALAQAVVRVNGCSASFISDAGLILTNHHCAFGAVQRNSTPEVDLLEQGFVAATWSQEKAAPGYRAEVLLSMTDVTDRVLADISDGVSDHNRFVAIENAIKAIVAECETPGERRCRVGAEFGGLRYTLFTSREILDIRLVYAPPRSVGEFGGEVDNKMWPRHTGDFALLRAYVAPDGSSAAFAPDNVPYRPARHLDVSTRGVRPGDLVLVLGYPGRTSRYLPAVAIAERIEFLYPHRLATEGRWMEILQAAAERSSAARLAVTSTIKRLANRLKNTRGMQQGLRRLHLLAAKEEEEHELAAWIDGDPGRQAEFGPVLDELAAIYRSGEETREKDFLLATMERASKTLAFARRLLTNSRQRALPDAERRPGYQDRDQARLAMQNETGQHDLDVPADRAVLAYFIETARALPADQRIAAVDAGAGDDAAGSPAAAATRFVDRLFAATRLTDLDERRRLFDVDRSVLDASDDAMVGFARALEPEYERMRERQETVAGALSRVLPLYAQLIRRRRGRVYPDANGTLRVSVATVKGYSPHDGVWMKPQTTLGGVMEKETGVAPFASPARLLAAARAPEAGRWRQAGLGGVPVCFLADADTTGGNSGSPVVNGRGELVGVNFDRVFENIAGDYAYSRKRSRNVSVDVRYLLWMLERVEHAWSLLREMGIEPSLPSGRKQEMKSDAAVAWVSS